jgi:hypothetical protein
MWSWGDTGIGNLMNAVPDYQSTPGWVFNDPGFRNVSMEDAVKRLIAGAAPTGKYRVDYSANMGEGDTRERPGGAAGDYYSVFDFNKDTGGFSNQLNYGNTAENRAIGADMTPFYTIPLMLASAGLGAYFAPAAGAAEAGLTASAAGGGIESGLGFGGQIGGLTAAQEAAMGAGTALGSAAPSIMEAAPSMASDWSFLGNAGSMGSDELMSAGSGMEGLIGGAETTPLATASGMAQQPWAMGDLPTYSLAETGGGIGGMSATDLMGYAKTLAPLSALNLGSSFLSGSATEDLFSKLQEQAQNQANANVTSNRDWYNSTAYPNSELVAAKQMANSAEMAAKLQAAKKSYMESAAQRGLKGGSLSGGLSSIYNNYLRDYGSMANDLTQWANTAQFSPGSGTYASYIPSTANTVTGTTQAANSLSSMLGTLGSIYAYKNLFS